MASDDPYAVLGVPKTATQKEIQSAFRQLAKKLHPDLHPGVKDAQEKFQEVSAAYDILGDAEKRGRYERGEIDASGAEKPQRRYYRDYADTGGDRYGATSGFADFDDTDDILSSIFGQGRRGGFHRGGSHRHYRLDVDFLDAVNGSSQRVSLPDGGTLEVTIPAGTADGQILRLKGKGEPAPAGGEAGDALIEIGVKPHAFFRRDGQDIRLDLPISLVEAVLGAKIEVPTPTGSVILTIPKNSSTGKILRLKGKGVRAPGSAAGDEYVTLKIMLPESADPELEAFASSWSKGQTNNPRRGMGL
jgi:DnaJ-class molecular chaperone